MKEVTWIAQLSVLAFILACADDAEQDPEECSVLSHDVRVGELFDVVAFGHDFSPFCEAGFVAAQDHAQWVADAWGEAPVDFDYQLFTSRDDACWPCDELVEGALGCAFSASLSATELPQRHEIAHAVRHPSCPPLLEEGWAMLYGGHFENAATTGKLSEAADAIESGLLPGELYPLASRFVAFLLETRGLDTVKSLCWLPGRDATSLDAALRQVLGQSLDEIAEEFEDYPEWSLGALRQDIACEGDPVTSSPGNWTANLECGAAGVEGQEGGRLVSHHLVDLPQSGAYTFRLQAEADFHIRLELRNCLREGMASIFYQTAHIYGQGGMPDELVLLDLPAGKYVVRLRLEDSAEPLALDLAMESWP